MSEVGQTFLLGEVILSQPGPPQSHGHNQVSVPSMALVSWASSSMRQWEEEAVSDISRKVAGMRARSISLILLVRPSERAVKTKMRIMFFMVL